MLWQRVASSLVLIPILIAAVWFGEPWVSLTAGIFAAVGMIEFCRLARSAGWNPFLPPAILLVVLFIVAAHSDDGRVMPLMVSAAVIVPLVRLLWRPEPGRAFINSAWTVSGVFYLGWTMSHFVLLRDLPEGREWVYLALFGTFASDTFSYFVGRAFGRRPLAPHISPKKTCEGAIGGVGGAVAATALLAVITGLDSAGWAKLIPLGFLISVFAQAGDLAESVLKRNADAKDAGNLLPGHGGVLDRLDSIVFTVVLVYYWVIWIVE